VKGYLLDLISAVGARRDGSRPLRSGGGADTGPSAAAA
jgi:hypothetical protein